ncbi:MAG: hypothetical protein OEM62_11205, partial [Acidobacteriota bacterium]|nr:hypothetical protein [Acidobacteriota bacterium]
LNSEARILNQALVTKLAEGGAVTVGEAVLEAQHAYAEAGRYRFMLEIYNIIGDPAVRIQ